MAALASTTLLLSACGGGGGSGGGGFGFPLPANTADRGSVFANPPPADGTGTDPVVNDPPPAGDTGRGTVVTSPPEQAAKLSADEFGAFLQADDKGRALLQMAGVPQCGIDTRYLEYRTVGGKGEATNATAAIMVPTGDDAACSGPRPVVLYAHGTDTARDYNIAKWTDPSQPASGEGVAVAAMLAAQGFIVVAPNYAGYDRSTLPYHPYLNGDQQGKDMVDALTAARKTFADIGASDAGSLFLTGYSQGGYVALAAHREMQAIGMPVTASAPMSAPSAISLLVDMSFQGMPALGSTVFVPLLTASWQQQFGDIYQSPDEIYESQYATGIDTLLPSLTPVNTLFAQGKLPPLALFPANASPGPVDARRSIFYGDHNLVRQSYLAQAADDIGSNSCPGNAMLLASPMMDNTKPLDCKPSNGLRKAAVANDLRNWVPARPVLMCGGHDDPTVSFASTSAMWRYFQAKGMPNSAQTFVNLEDANASDAYAAVRASFAQAKSALAQSTPGSDADKAQAVMRAYHGTLVPPFCMVAARGFFQGVLSAGN